MTSKDIQLDEDHAVYISPSNIAEFKCRARGGNRDMNPEDIPTVCPFCLNRVDIRPLYHLSINRRDWEKFDWYDDRENYDPSDDKL
jgi:hypothetical protein